MKVPRKYLKNFNQSDKKLEKHCNIYWCWLLGFCIVKWKKYDVFQRWPSNFHYFPTVLDYWKQSTIDVCLHSIFINEPFTWLEKKSMCINSARDRVELISQIPSKCQHGIGIHTIVSFVWIFNAHFESTIWKLLWRQGQQGGSMLRMKHPWLALQYRLSLLNSQVYQRRCTLYQWHSFPLFEMQSSCEQ